MDAKVAEGRSNLVGGSGMNRSAFFKEVEIAERQVVVGASDVALRRAHAKFREDKPKPG